MRGTGHRQHVTIYESGNVHTMMDVKDAVAKEIHGVYENGQLAMFNENSNDKPHGERRHFLPDGTLYGQTFYDHSRELRNVVIREINRSENKATMGSNPRPHAVWNVKR